MGDFLEILFLFLDYLNIYFYYYFISSYILSFYFFLYFLFTFSIFFFFIYLLFFFSLFFLNILRECQSDEPNSKLDDQGQNGHLCVSRLNKVSDETTYLNEKVNKKLFANDPNLAWSVALSNNYIIGINF